MARNSSQALPLHERQSNFGLVDFFKYFKRRSRYRVAIPIPSAILSHPVELKRLKSKVSVSVIIPTRDNVDLLEKAVESVIENSSNLDLELIVINNGSTDPKSEKYFSLLRSNGHLVLEIDEPFNFSKLCNEAIKIASKSLICLMNNDVTVTTPTWAHSANEHLRLNRVGMVGAILNYPSGAVQHAGIALGMNGIAGHIGRGDFPEELAWLQNDSCLRVSGATFALVVIPKQIFEKVGGLDEKLPVGFNDVDFALRLKSFGYQTHICSKVRGVHLESATRPPLYTLRGFIRAFRDMVYILKKYSATNFIDSNVELRG